MAEPARHFTVKSLARYWSCSPSHVYGIISSGNLRRLLIGGAIRIPATYVEEYENRPCPNIALRKSQEEETGISSGATKGKQSETQLARKTLRRLRRSSKISKQNNLDTKNPKT